MQTVLPRHVVPAQRDLTEWDLGILVGRATAYLAGNLIGYVGTLINNSTFRGIEIKSERNMRDCGVDIFVKVADTREARPIGIHIYIDYMDLRDMCSASDLEGYISRKLRAMLDTLYG